MARTLEELNLHIIAQSERILDLDRELFRRRGVLKELCTEKELLLRQLPIGYVVALTRRGYPQYKLSESLSPIPIYLRDQGRTITLTKGGGHKANVNADGTIAVGITGIMCVLRVGETAISCGGVVIRYGRSMEDVRRGTISFGEIKAVL